MTTTAIISEGTTSPEKQCYTVIIYSDTLNPGGSFVEADSNEEGSVAVGLLTERGVERMKKVLLGLGFTSEWTPIGQPRGYYYTPSYFIQSVVDGLKETAAHPSSKTVIVTSKDLLNGSVDLSEGTYLYNGNPITLWGLLPGGVLELDTVEGTFSLELPCILFKG